MQPSHSNRPPLKEVRQNIKHDTSARTIILAGLHQLEQAEPTRWHRVANVFDQVGRSPHGFGHHAESPQYPATLWASLEGMLDDHTLERNVNEDAWTTRSPLTAYVRLTTTGRLRAGLAFEELHGARQSRLGFVADIRRLAEALMHGNETTAASAERLNSHLERHHSITRNSAGVGVVRATDDPASIDLLIPAPVLHQLLVDAYQAGGEGALVSARLKERIRNTPPPPANEWRCDHNSPRENSSGIGAFTCGDCGAFVGRRPH